MLKLVQSSPEDGNNLIVLILFSGKLNIWVFKHCFCCFINELNMKLKTDLLLKMIKNKMQPFLEYAQGHF